MSRKTLFIASFIVLLLITGIVAFAQTQTLSGWAWSDNIGWISISGPLYGVIVNSSTGAFSGYAWSDNIGWVSFNAADVGGCPSGSCSPILNMATGIVTGWARACAGTNNGNCTGGSRTDGWDGWISLRGASPDYGVIVDGSTFGGWAWGSAVVGWISFNSQPITTGGGTNGGSGGGGSGWGVNWGGFAGVTPLSISCSGNPDPVEVDQTVTWSTLISGGQTPYSYAWSGDTSGTTADVSAIYSTAGTKTANVAVIDNAGQNANAICDIKVAPKPKRREVIP